MLERQQTNDDTPRHEKGSFGEAFAALTANAPSLTDDLIFYFNWHRARIRVALIERKEKKGEREK